ncbi:hypothetical protein BD311DRAFT_773404 [Dichomitus squalens]|uniref:MYND-type domain-containing protein n=1 Tax=Dichomitus squalens TaxID=114155 RepID=A0A4Q9N3U7_9APHY|nr:hypothetical protein BD311DRAFT_773404 [Dichomitus squalens]
MAFDLSVNPTAAQAMGIGDGVALNNEALRLESQGDLAGAEHKHLEAIRITEAGLGTDHFTPAALRVREHSGPAADLAVTRDNLGKLYEVKGDLQVAQDIRLEGAPDNIACGNYNCPKFQNSLSSLSKCSACKKADWKRHKNYCRRR